MVDVICLKVIKEDPEFDGVQTSLSFLIMRRPIQLMFSVGAFDVRVTASVCLASFTMKLRMARRSLTLGSIASNGS